MTSTSTTKVPSHSSSESSTSSGATSVIPLSTVIGVCIGAFVGAGLLICLSIWFYRRSSRRRPPRRPRQKLRGNNPAAPWTRFDDDRDQWEGQNGMSEKKGPGSLALVPGTQRTISPQPARRSLTSDGHDAASQSLPFTHYHPNLAEQMALEPPPPVGLGHRSQESLGGSTADSYLSLGTVHIESGKMSPTFNMAKMTPPATSSKLHRWESAVVIDPGADAQEVEIHSDPFLDDATPTTSSPTETFGDRRSIHNPFFNAQAGAHSRQNTIKKPPTVSVSSDPFNREEEDITTMPKPRFISHDSSSSGGSGNERSLQSLIAALELPQAVIEERLRVASMQPSEISRYSTASDSPVVYPMPMPEATERRYV